MGLISRTVSPGRVSNVATFRVSPEDEVRYGLLRDEWLTIATKPVMQTAERGSV